MANTWQLQEAKNQLSQVVENALKQGAQTITRHGKPAVVVLSASDYQRIRPRRKKLVEVLRACPVKDLRLSRVKDTPRDVAL
ncbi:MAG: type II toxin-antitoxin system Phd/YefM family antitoxin [Verrucomicrobia bacterium]|nr:type II toxin-antitoxin system Phd/YefM family antitoxin [Verrucomicrobiota bacterium]